jgi:nucleotide-binding universal stress UspA family protein
MTQPLVTLSSSAPPIAAPRPQAQPQSPRPVVLCAMGAGAFDANALRRAFDIASAAGAELELAVVVAVSDPVASLFPHGHLAAALRSVELGAGAATALSSFAERTLPERVAAGDVSVYAGPFRDAVERAAIDADADLLVLGAEALDGAAARALCHRLRRAVLVARAPHAGGAVVASSDLEHAELPVLQRARALGRILGARTVLFHSVDAAEETVATAAERDARTSDLAARLTSVLERFLPEVRVTLSAGDDPAHAIVAAARALDADVIVVGVHGAPFALAPVGPHVAASVADGARRSVLLAPIGALARPEAILT